MADDNMHLYVMEYLGYTAMDKRFSRPMLPWIIAEIKRRGSTEKVCVGVHDGCVVALDTAAEPTDPGAPPTPLLRHPLAHVWRIMHAPHDARAFLYVVREPAQPLLTCHLFRATDAADVVELFQAMRHEQAREDSAAATAAAAAAGGASVAAGAGAAGRRGMGRRGPAGPSGARPLTSCAATLTALPADISPCSSHFFEVLYIGKIKVSHKKVPDTFIDDALEKFRAHELEKGKGKISKCSSLANGSEQKINHQNANNLHSSSSCTESGQKIIITLERDNSIRRDSEDSNSPVEENNNSTRTVLLPTEIITSDRQSTLGNEDSGCIDSINTDNKCTNNTSDIPVETIVQGGVQNQLQTLEPRPQSPIQDSQVTKQSSIQLEPMRNRAASTGSAKEFKKSDSSNSADHNRIMLFQVGRTDLHLISPDRKQILLHKHLKDVASCIQGIQQADHFGFICRESNVESYIAYVFKCQSESVADDVVAAITQAFLATSEAQRREKVPVFSCEHCPMVWYHRLCTEIEGLNEKKTTMAIFRRLELLPEEEQSTILTKFRGAETNSSREQNEFLMMLLRAHCESKQARHVHDTAENRHEFLNQYLGGSTIFMKAKRSLTSSFDQLLKRKGSRDDFGPIVKELSLPINAALCKQVENGETGMRRRSSTVGTATGETMKKELQSKHNIVGLSPGVPQQQIPASPPNGPQLVHQKSSPMMNIFFKVGNTPKTSPTQENHDIVRQTGSWRQAIFNRVVTPSKSESASTQGRKKERNKRDRSELRALWKKAINQQLLLIRMEKENARLRARQEEATVKRIKLEYEEISPCMREVVEVWDLLISKESRITAKCDSQMLLQAIKQGVPRSKRGDVWQFLAEQHCLKMPPIDTLEFPNFNVPYETLLKQLTSHPHNILVDLGRTFPGHTYFASPLGPGQLALFNLLKAYSLLDPEVGYCQGLNFVAGVLLLHMPEDSAFFLLKHLMFRRGLRRQYLPDMAALQVQLYQLSRLLHDQHPDLYMHFDIHEIAPTLYAAPWILTVFASQFPLGFSPEVIFRVALALLSEHKEGLLSCENFEEIMDYLKTRIPKVDKCILDKIMKQVFTMDITKQLHEYEVEYHVLQEEMASPRPEYEDLHRLEEANKLLTQQNHSLSEQLEIATSNIHRLETTRTAQQASINRLESQIRSLEVSIVAMGNFISSLAESRTDIDIPGDVRRLLTHLSVVEQRRNSLINRQNVLNPNNTKGIPLKVIDSGEVYGQKNYALSDVPVTNGNGDNGSVTIGGKQARRTSHPLKSTLSSPNLSAKLNSMSSFFGNSHNNSKTPKLSENKSENETVISIDAKKNSNQGIAKLSAKSDVNGKVTPDSTARNEGCLDKASSKSVPLPSAKLKSSQSAFELAINSNYNNENIVKERGDIVISTESSDHIHPLDTCLGVNFTYGGTTKLKTIRPLRAQLSRHASSDSLRTVKTAVDESSSVIANPCLVDGANSNNQNESQTLSSISQTKTTLLSR
ncbi:Ecotropic viral integration site 5 ortholog [Gryllus bimaculatus]|nr:Ecotropic viral integration site 5 ortholog [Gryllus bimaculatus]